jgi:hypothetical protein
VTGIELKKALDKLPRCRIVDGLEISSSRGKYVRFEDVKTIICQAIADANREQSK